MSVTTAKQRGLNGADVLAAEILDRAATTLATIPSFCVAQEVAFSVNDHNPGGNCFPQIVFSKTNQKYINVQASASARL